MVGHARRHAASDEPFDSAETANGIASLHAGNLTNVISGTVDDVSQPAAVLALVVWAALPAMMGLVAVQRRDVVRLRSGSKNAGARTPEQLSKTTTALEE